VTGPLRTLPLLASALLCILHGVLPLEAAAAERGIASVVARIKPSIVGVGTYDRIHTPPAELRGTGFVVGDGNYALTNFHVLPQTAGNSKTNTSLAVFVPESGNNSSMRQAEVIGFDEEHDIALLRFGGGKLPAMTLGNASRVREGDEYAFTGFPIGPVLGLYPVTHRAMISAISPIAIPARDARGLDPRMLRKLADSFNVFQLDGTAYPGNSGSPLYDTMSGEVLGIINKVFVQETKENILSRPSGISYAIPISFGIDLIKRKPSR
jgi:S1-C subfamily serine protease